MADVLATGQTPATDPTRWARYVALGDSFTEGMVDPLPPTATDPDPHRGWADRLAERLDAERRAAGLDGLEYANLAVRGRLLGQILDEQVPVALAAEPDLVSIVGGGNDVLRPGSDPDALADRLEGAVARLRAAGADVLMCTGADPRGNSLVGLTRGKVGVFNAHVWSIGQRQGAFVMDLFGTAAIQDFRMWAPDRIHLNSTGHERVADLAASSLGLDTDPSWRVPLDAAPPTPWRQAARDQAEWARTYVGPWVGRRLRRQSSGDGREPKRPVPLRLERAGRDEGGSAEPSSR